MRPSLEELRLVAQPAELLRRRNGEHWAGRYYMRKLSLRVTRRLTTSRLTPNALTLAMIVTGWIAAGAVGWPWIVLVGSSAFGTDRSWVASPGAVLLSAVVAFVLVQLYLLFDCVDGELARWRKVTSATGVYLDRLGHYVVEGALLAAFGARVSALRSSETSTTGDLFDGWVVLGLVAALLALISKLETDLVVVARAGKRASATSAGSGSRLPHIRTARRLVSVLPAHRLLGAVELSIALVVATIVDVSLSVVGPVAATTLLATIAAMSFVVAAGHPITILTSDRLK